jgi:hypothetical protein
MSLTILIFNAQGAAVTDAQLSYTANGEVQPIAFDAEMRAYTLPLQGDAEGEVKASHPQYEIDALPLSADTEAGTVLMSAGARGDACTVFRGRRFFYRVIEEHLGATLLASALKEAATTAALQKLESELELVRVPSPFLNGGIDQLAKAGQARIAYRLGKNSPSISSVLQRLRASGLYAGVGELRVDGTIPMPDVQVVTGQAGLAWLREQNFDPQMVAQARNTYTFTMSTSQELKADTVWKKMARTGLFESFWQEAYTAVRTV